jgi:hypothetical protein
MLHHMNPDTILHGIGSVAVIVLTLYALGAFVWAGCEFLWRRTLRLRDVTGLLADIRAARKVPELERSLDIWRTCAGSRWDDLHEAHVRYGRLHAAVHALYTSARWSASQLPADEQAALWENLRDAAEFMPGTATLRGVGAESANEPMTAVDMGLQMPAEQRAA